MPPSGTSSLQTKWLLLPLAHAIAPHAKRIEKAHPLLISALPRTHWLKLSHGRSARVFVYAACAAAGMAQALPAMAQTSPAANPPVPAAPETSKKPPETTAPTEQQPAVQALPPVVVTETAAPAKKPKAAAHKAKTVPSAVKPSAVTPSAAAGTQPAAVSAPASLLAIQGDAFNQARSSLLTQVGTNSFTFSREAIEALPQGTETPVSKLLLQAPGVTQDFGGERSDPRPQRARQSSIPHQWHHPSRWGFRLRRSPQIRLRRKSVTRHRSVARRVRPAHLRPCRHHHAGRQ